MSTTDDPVVVNEPPDDDVAIGESPDGDRLGGDQARWLLTNRRKVLIGLGTLGSIAAIAEADLGGSGGGNLYGGTMALDKAYKVGERSYLGPESLKDNVISEIPDSEGWEYRTSDTNVRFWLDDNAWQGPVAVGSSSTSVPSVHTDKQSFTDADLIVTPSTHDFDAIVSELNAGKTVYAMPGTYPGDDTQKTVTDGSLIAADGAVIDVPATPPAGWLVLEGSTGTPTDITADVSAGDTTLTVADTSGFESGKPALINDDAVYVSGTQTMNNGEIVYVDEVVDGTTLELRAEVEFPHSTTDTISIEPVEPLTHENSWVGVEFDCRGSDQSGGAHPLIFRRYVDGHEFRNITFRNGDGSAMHQYLETRHSWNPKLTNSRSGRVEDGELGLFCSPEQRTRNAEVRDCVVYHGQVCQFGNGGVGPSVEPIFENVITYGSQFSSSHTERRAEYRNCRAYRTELDYYGNQPAFRSQSYRTKFVNCTVVGGNVGFKLDGVGETVSGCTIEGVNQVFKFASSNSNHPDAGTEPVTIEGGQFREWNYLLNVRDNFEGVRISDADMYGNLSSRWIDGSAVPDAVTILGGYMEKGRAFNHGLPKLTVRGLEFDGGNQDTQFIRETDTTVNDELVFSDCEFYNTGNADAVRVANYDYVQMSECRVPMTEAAISYHLFREEGGSGSLHCVLRGNDGRNAQTSNGFSTAGTPVTDGTNIDNTGAAF